MAVKTAADLKAKFENGDIPDANDFIDLIDTIFAQTPGGDYTPTASGLSNVSSVTNLLASYSKMGDYVVISGSGTCNISSAALVAFKLSLDAQIASALGTGFTNVRGVVSLGASIGGWVSADSDSLNINFVATGTGVNNFTFIAHFKVV